MLNTSTLGNHTTRNGLLRSLAIALVSLAAAASLLPAVGAAETATTQLSWPAITPEQRPWAYWWWMGSAVDKTNLTRELIRYRDAGYGGVHIIPIYGAKGWETNYINYLSPRWMDMLKHTVTEANRLDLGVDMTTGSGWCFGGGPNVTEHEGNASVVVKTFDVAAGGALVEKLDAQKTQALVAFPVRSSRGNEAQTEIRPVDLTKKMRPDGSVNWTAKEGDWRVYAISQKFSGQKVKRAGPGGEGPMLNLLYPAAMGKFLQPFTDAFAKYDGPKPRAQYHDSYEYKSEWAPDFFQQFEQRRGYKLQTQLPALFSEMERRPDRSRRREEADAANTNALATSPVTDADRVARVLCDYRETASDIQIEDSLPQWVKWSHNRGFLTRNEAHGSPGNLLDLYAVADVPETEMFNKDRNKLISKFASSAAHVTGKKLVGCETGTWLKEHFTETLADMKYLLDDLFVSGVNHVFYHGTCYSPDEAAWPGWLFYASYEMNPRNSVWRDVPALNTYVARCQSILQSGNPDNDILLYWPIHDFWHTAPATPRLPHFTVHARSWFEAQPVGQTAAQLWDSGFTFDYVSDRQLARANGSQGEVRVPGGAYRVVLVPTCTHMALETMEKLLSLAQAGATIIFERHLPQDVPGLGNLEKRRAAFKKILGRVKLMEIGDGPLQGAQLGKGRVIVGELAWALGEARIAREPMVDHAGLFFIRREFGGGRHYFIANRGDQAVDQWVTLAMSAKSVVVMDPMNGRAGVGALRSKGQNKIEVYLQLQPGESVILRTFTERRVDRTAWPHTKSAGAPVEITGEWNAKFIQGGPVLPPGFHATKLASWAELGGEEAQRFAGTARYSITFDAPGSEFRLQAASGNAGSLKPELRTWLLDLGKVCQSARVRLNGRELGTLITPPFRVAADNLKPTGNLLEVEVTNISANRIRDLDRRGVKWKNFHDINFVNQDYRPFDASNWPLYDSGLLGPVTLTAVHTMDPAKEDVR